MRLIMSFLTGSSTGVPPYYFQWTAADKNSVQSFTVPLTGSYIATMGGGTLTKTNTGVSSANVIIRIGTTSGGAEIFNGLDERVSTEFLSVPSRGACVPVLKRLSLTAGVTYYLANIVSTNTDFVGGDSVPFRLEKL
jgi:hypothetical protein